MSKRQTRGIPLGELPPQAQEKARAQLSIELGPNSPLRREVDAELAKSRNAATRSRSGAYFQQELARVHAWYQDTRRAQIRQHHPATAGVPAVVDKRGHVVRPGTMHFRAGGAPCDFGGIARVAGKVRGILFDAKVITGTATYAHLGDQYHQLEELALHQFFKGIGFLLLADQELGIAYLVQDLTPLLAHQPITLRDTPRKGRARIGVDEMTHHYPLVRRPPDFSPVSHYARWDWLATLEALYAA